VTAQTVNAVNKVMQQRLIRGCPVIVADSVGQADLRGKTLIVSSKGPVKCNRGGRCAGDWCVGLAVFLADPKSSKKDKKMGWRKDTAKVCLTHIKDENGDLVVPPPFARQQTALRPRPSTRLPDPPPTNGCVTHPTEVTWADLAEAHSAGDLERLALLARALKAQSEILKSTVIESQTKLIEHLTGK